MSRDSLPPLEDEFTRALLGSAEADGPSRAAYAKVAATLGVGVSIGASLPAAAGIGAAGAASVARWSSSLGAKLFLGFSGALLLGGAAALLARGSEAVKPVPQTSAAHAPAIAQAKGEPLPLASTRGEPDDVRAVAPSAAFTATNKAATRPVGQGQGSAALRAFTGAPAARRSPHAAPVRAADSSLSEQVQSLDRARVALGAGDSSAALAEIARYRAAWPSGVFLTEASVLEIEALAARGERSSARARAADFVAAHPDSPQADRLRALLPTKKP